MRNETQNETYRNGTKRNEAERNLPKRKETERNEMKRNEIYRSETERNETKCNVHKTGRECKLAKRIYRNGTKQNMSKYTCLFQARFG